MKVARSLLSGLFLSVLMSACAGGGAANRSPSEPYLFSSAQPSRASSVVAPPARVNDDDGAWSNIWTAQARLADRTNVAR